MIPIIATSYCPERVLRAAAQERGAQTDPASLSELKRQTLGSPRCLEFTGQCTKEEEAAQREL